MFFYTAQPDGRMQVLLLAATLVGSLMVLSLIHI